MKTNFFLTLLLVFLFESSSHSMSIKEIPESNTIIAIKDCYGVLNFDDYEIWNNILEQGDKKAKEEMIKDGRVIPISKGKSLYIVNTLELLEGQLELVEGELDLFRGKIDQRSRGKIDQKKLTPKARMEGDTRILYIFLKDF